MKRKASASKNKNIKDIKKNTAAFSKSQNAIAKYSRTAVKEKFPVIGIGASAGGLEALEQFFSHTPVNNGMAFVVIQHLDPTHKGIMPELLQRFTTIKVVPVTDRMKVNPDTIYVIPSNKNMSILNGVLHLFEPVKTHGLRLPIDFFFRALADDMMNKSIGIILSGMGSDGSVGLKAIKEKGGIVLVQDPGSAKFDGMPRSAIDTVLVDIVAPADELPEKLISFLHTDLKGMLKIEFDSKDKTSLEKIIILLRSQTGQDFSLYKKSSMYRRIERRMNVLNIEKIAYYVRYLQENPAEARILFKEMLIGVTSFFRDSAVWEKIRDKIFPELFKDLPDRYTLRAWIPGCSTGEEAYSLAIVFKEALGKMKHPKNLSLQIFATDIDGDVIEQARKGTFHENIAQDVSASRLHKYFTRSADSYRVNTSVRETIVFAAQNVVNDPPFTNLDILVCRNLLIYMESELQSKLFALFHYSLNPGGILLLGSAETVSLHNNFFMPVDSKLRLYRRTGTQSVIDLIDFPKSFPYKTMEMSDQKPLSKITGNIQTLADELVLQQFAPPSILVNNRGDIVYIIGRTGKFLEPASGKANMNIFAMARKGLRDELPAAFRQALENNNQQVKLHNIKVGTNGGTESVDILVKQIDKPEVLKGMMLIVFSEAHEDIIPVGKKIKKGKPYVEAIQTKLERELKQVKENLQNTMEEMQTSQEELKSTNEELQSTNEELQSTNEELTTSKEEMQSLNEELQTVNIELQNKVDEYTRVNSDMRNLLNSTDIATLFLDRNLCIRRFTNNVTKIFKMAQRDIDRPFTDLVSILIYPEIGEDARSVLQNLVFIEKTVHAYDGRWYQTRIMPYRTYEDKIDGLVLTFFDITKSKVMELSLRNNIEIFRSLIKSLSNIIIIMMPEGNIIELNPEAEKYFGISKKGSFGKNYFELLSPAFIRESAEKEFQKLLNNSLTRKFNTQVIISGGDTQPIQWSIDKLLDQEGKVESIIFVGQMENSK